MAQLVLLWRAVLVTACFALLLVGCGGGSGGSSPAPQPNPTPPPPPPPPPAPCGGWTGTVQIPAAQSHSNIVQVQGIGTCSFIVAGYENSSSPGEPLGNSRGFLRQYSIDAQGQPQQQWGQLLETAGSDAVLGFDVGPDFIRFWGSTTAAIDGAINAGGKDIVLGALSRAGALQKLSQLGNERPNVPLRLLDVSADARILVGNDDVYVPTNYVEAWEDPWLAGIMEFPDSFAVDGFDNRSTPNTDVYTDAELFHDSLLLALRSENLDDRGISLRRQQPAGSLLWNRAITANPFDQVAAIRIQSDRVFVFGTTYEQLGDQLLGAGDYFLAELNPDTGALVWLEQLGGPNTDWASALVLTAASFTLVGEVNDAVGNWSGVVIDLDTARREVSRRSVTLGRSLSVRSAGRIPEGLLVSGQAEFADNTTSGFVRFLPDQS